MDPLSITAATVSLAGAVGNTTVLIADFVGAMRSARKDLVSTSRHLGELSSTLDLLRNDDTAALPDAHRLQIRSILTSCESILGSLDAELSKPEYKSARGPAKWALSGKKEADELNKKLEAHLRTLGLAVEATTLSLAQDIHEDTGAIRVDAVRILDEIVNLRADLRAAAPSDEAAQGDEDAAQQPNFIINRYLDSLTEYAGTVVDNASVYRRDDVPAAHGSVYLDEEDEGAYPQSDDLTRNDPPPLPVLATFTKGIAKTANGENKLVALSPEGHFVAIQDCPVHREGLQKRILGCWEVTVYESRSGLVVLKYNCRNEIAKALVFSSNSELFAVLADKKAKIFDTRGWKIVWETDIRSYKPASLCFSNDNTTIAISTTTKPEGFRFYGIVSIYELEPSRKRSMRFVEDIVLAQSLGLRSAQTLTPELKLSNNLSPVVLFDREDNPAAGLGLHYGDSTWTDVGAIPLPSGHRLVGWKDKVVIYKLHTQYPGNVLECFDVSKPRLEGPIGPILHLKLFDPLGDSEPDDQPPALLDIKIVGLHHLALFARYPGQGKVIQTEVLSLGRVDPGLEDEQSTPTRIFGLVRQRSRYTWLEEGIISEDGRTLLLKFKLRYLGREQISSEHMVGYTERRKEIEPGSAVEVWPLPPLDSGPLQPLVGL
ncbi:hypothetical protein QBC34DRAFT_435411 [Podospora aff. communis PSN243]|uniref:Fungal N-terminal domain-containing protein n=1 Tax=Podospora aff. communis PSN243 TaxID=3040156 RepID=A0AAV9GW93_9PEZI|nr:hypothetical protein QBC34DRAFT_435411 [Podospora aff. communis PSN243]